MLCLSSQEAADQLTSYDAIQQYAHQRLTPDAQSIFIEGGKMEDSSFNQGYWTNGKDAYWIGYPDHLINLPNLSQAVTTCLKLGYPIKEALVIAAMHDHQCARLNRPLSLPHHWPEAQIDLPYLSVTPLRQLPPTFKPCHLGLYPVVDSSQWVASLLPQGITCIQLRIKSTSQSLIEDEIKQSVALAKHHGATLFINDYWDLAIQFGATGVHLGQDDLEHADIDKIYRAGLHLGISTHDYYEVARAHALNPSYIACGPVYTTTSKAVSVQPQGIAALERFRRTLDYPLVAIGGITFNNLSEILKSGVEGIAVISAITQAADPIVATQQLLTHIRAATVRERNS